MSNDQNSRALKRYKQDKIILAGSIGLCAAGLVASFSSAVLIDLAHSDRTATPWLKPLQDWVKQPEQMELFGPESNGGALWSLSLWPATAMTGVVAAATAQSLSDQRRSLRRKGYDL